MSDPKEEVDMVKSEVLFYANSISGWDYDDDDSVHNNVTSVIRCLISKIESDATRIQNLQLKLGQLVERGP